MKIVIVDCSLEDPRAGGKSHRKRKADRILVGRFLDQTVNIVAATITSPPAVLPKLCRLGTGDLKVKDDTGDTVSPPRITRFEGNNSLILALMFICPFFLEG